MDWRVLLDFAIVAAVMAPLERLFALRPGRSLHRRDVLLDLTHALASGVLIRIGVGVLVLGAHGLGASVLTPELRQGVKGLPIWVAAPLALLIADLGFYAAHRAFHAVPALWRFHAVHHSIEHLDWLAAHRVHPVDQILTKTASLAPLFFLGFSPLALGVFAVVYKWQSLCVHANTRLRLGLLEQLIASPRFHHWHHANQKEAFDRNFAGQLSILDRLFGTLHLPAHRYPERYGTEDPVPRRYLAQLAYPFTRASASATAATAASKANMVEAWRGG